MNNDVDFTRKRNLTFRYAQLDRSDRMRGIKLLQTITMIKTLGVPIIGSINLNFEV